MPSNPPAVSYNDQTRKQRDITDAYFETHARVRKYPLHDYIGDWRIRTAFRVLMKNSHGLIDHASKILLVGAADGFEASALLDIGFRDVVISDISPAALAAAARRDQRVKTICLNLEDLACADGSFDVVAAQDCLHHLQNPVRGFTEMLRVAKHAVIFLEPHDSIIGRTIGKSWEIEGDAVNYVFRWNRRLVKDVTSSYLGKRPFANLSFSFCHHNVLFERVFGRISMGRLGCALTAGAKFLLDGVARRWGNQFCGIVLKRDAADARSR